MNKIKKSIKKMVGQTVWSNTSATVKFIKEGVFNFSSKKCIVHEGWGSEVYSLKGKHVFFGYYDIQQLNEDETKLLAHVVKKDAATQTDKASIGYFDTITKEYHEITTTSAWCWQQGSRLRWHPLEKNSVVLNNCIDGKLVCQIYNLNNKSLVQTIDAPLYDINKEFTYGLSLNFPRLQRLRPGYGYNCIEDETRQEKAPKNDGIFFVDLQTNRKTLIVSLYDLAKEVDPDLRYEHYINHISISPDGNKFIFFHIWNISEGTGWRTRLYVYDLSSKSISLLEDLDKVSHYDWMDNCSVLVTCYTTNKEQYYALYNTKKGEKTVIESIFLNRDGHPSFCSDLTSFITDTYPQVHCRQHLFEFNLDNQSRTPIVDIYSSPLLYGEKRCDLHPRLSLSEKKITFDSTCYSNKRSIILLSKEN